MLTEITTPILTSPGYTSSGPQHWQTLWEREFSNIQRIAQRSWTAPDRVAWIESIQQHVVACKTPPLLIGHSLGSLAIVHALNAHPLLQIRAVMLVAPCDVEERAREMPLESFAPVPLTRLPVPSILVYSNNDPFLSAERAHFFAQCWGSKACCIGAAGHINSESNLGEWPQGKSIMRNLLDSGLAALSP